MTIKEMSLYWNIPKDTLRDLINRNKIKGTIVNNNKMRNFSLKQVEIIQKLIETYKPRPKMNRQITINYTKIIVHTFYIYESKMNYE